MEYSFIDGIKLFKKYKIECWGYNEYTHYKNYIYYKNKMNIWLLHEYSDMFIQHIYHEIAHYLLASNNMRKYPEYGLGASTWGNAITSRIKKNANKIEEDTSFLELYLMIIDKLPQYYIIKAINEFWGDFDFSIKRMKRILKKVNIAYNEDFIRTLIKCFIKFNKRHHYTMSEELLKFFNKKEKKNEITTRRYYVI